MHGKLRDGNTFGLIEGEHEVPDHLFDAKFSVGYVIVVPHLGMLAAHALFLGVGNEKKLEMAKNCGADYVFSTTAVNLPEECRKLTGGRGVDISADFAGNKAATELAFACLAPGGVQVQPGYSPGEKFEVDYMHFLVGERTLVASRAATKKSLEGALKLVAEGKVKPQIDSSAIMPLERVNEILDRLKAGDIIGRGVIKYY